MEYVRRACRAVGPVVLAVGLLSVPLLLAPTPAQADSGICGGYDTVECSTVEWCIGLKDFGFGVCVTEYNYWPEVNPIQEAMEEAMIQTKIDYHDSLEGYYPESESGDGGGGAF